MLVRMLTCMAGDRFVREVGSEHEIEDSESLRLITAGFAEPSDGVIRSYKSGPVDGPTPPAKGKRGRPPKEKPSPTGGPVDTAVATLELPNLPSNDSDDDDTPEL